MDCRRDVLLPKRKPPEPANEVCQCAVHKRCHDKILGKCPGSGKESQNTIVSPPSLSRARVLTLFVLPPHLRVFWPADFSQALPSVFLLRPISLHALETFSGLRAWNKFVFRVLSSITAQPRRSPLCQPYGTVRSVVGEPHL